MVARGRAIREADHDARSAPRRGEDRLKAIRIHRATDTRIFRTLVESLRLYVSTSHRGVRSLRFITVHNDAQLIPAKLLHSATKASV